MKYEVVDENDNKLQETYDGRSTVSSLSLSCEVSLPNEPSCSSVGQSVGRWTGQSASHNFLKRLEVSFPEPLLKHLLHYSYLASTIPAVQPAPCWPGELYARPTQRSLPATEGAHQYLRKEFIF